MSDLPVALTLWLFFLGVIGFGLIAWAVHSLYKRWWP